MGILAIHLAGAADVSALAEYAAARVARANQHEVFVFAILPVALGLLKAGMSWSLTPVGITRDLWRYWVDRFANTERQ